MEITFESSSPSTVTYPTPPAEYIFKPGITKATPMKKKNGAIGIIIGLCIPLVLIIGAVYLSERPRALDLQDPRVYAPPLRMPPTATVINERLNIRSGPSTRNSVVIQVHKGDILTITGEIENGWLPVEYDSKAGFVSADLVKINE